MDTAVMTPAHEAAAFWPLAAGEVVRLAPCRTGRWLRLREGRLWATLQARRSREPAEDRWLLPGQTLRLAPGVAVVAEGWPSAVFELLEEPRG